METCYRCHGEGGWHDCGEDTCCCLDPHVNEICKVCDGEGVIGNDDEYFEEVF
jgi:hypothetical protein